MSEELQREYLVLERRNQVLLDEIDEVVSKLDVERKRVAELEEKLLEAKERIALLEDEVVSEREDADYYRGAYLEDHDPPGEDW